MNVPSVALLEHLAASTAEPLYLVGGAVRDLLSGSRDIRDIDLVMPAGSATVARRFADAVGGSFFFLDEERGITRVLTPGAEDSCQFDFTDFEGPDLQADLARRDFTVNAMALDLHSFLRTGSTAGVIDLFRGQDDLQRRLIRVTAPRVLNDDPLRMLRAVRFAATLGFTVEPGTEEEIRKRAGLALLPSGERIRDELFLTLSVPGAERHLLLLESLGLLRRLIPELDRLKDFAPGRHHQYDVLTHSVRTAGHVDSVLEDLCRTVPVHAAALREHLDAPLEQSVTRAAALRFACLLHDSAKAETYSRDESGDIHFFGHDALGAEKAKDICQRFRLSNDTTSVVTRLIRHHMRPLGLATSNGPSKRALYRYCRDLKDALPESILLALADGRATVEVMPDGFLDMGPTAVHILEYYYTRFLKVAARPLVTGRDLIARGLTPGPEFRRILDDIRERQAEGELSSRDDALRYLGSRER